MDTYDIDPSGFLLGTANPDRGYPGPVVVAPPFDRIAPARCRWNGIEWIEDASREQADAMQAAMAKAIAMVQSRLDTLAQSWGYDDIKSGCTYAGDPYPRFNAEGTVMRAWRSATWAAVDEHRDAKSLDELVSYLPPIPQRPQ